MYRNRERVIIIYKGDEPVFTGTIDAAAEYYGVNVDTITFMLTPTAHKKNKGLRKIAYYLDDQFNNKRTHNFMLAVCRLWKEEQRPIELIEAGVEAGFKRSDASTIASKEFTRLFDLGYVERIIGRYKSYVPTEKGIAYGEEYAKEES